MPNSFGSIHLVSYRLSAAGPKALSVVATKTLFLKPLTAVTSRTASSFPVPIIVNKSPTV